MNKHDRELKDLLQSIREGLTGPGLCTIADRQYKRLFAPRKRTERERASVKAKAEKRQGRREKVAAIRSEVMARAGGKCELCWATFGAVAVGPAEWHHIIGAGLRRHREAVDTTIALCRGCHRAWENGDANVLGGADVWAHRNGFEAAREAIKHRAAKAAECRATRAKETRD